MNKMDELFRVSECILKLYKEVITLEENSKDSTDIYDLISYFSNREDKLISEVISNIEDFNYLEGYINDKLYEYNEYESILLNNLNEEIKPILFRIHNKMVSILPYLSSDYLISYVGESLAKHASRNDLVSSAFFVLAVDFALERTIPSLLLTYLNKEDNNLDKKIINKFKIYETFLHPNLENGISNRIPGIFKDFECSDNQKRLLSNTVNNYVITNIGVFLNYLISSNDISITYHCDINTFNLIFTSLFNSYLDILDDDTYNSVIISIFNSLDKLTPIEKLKYYKNITIIKDTIYFRENDNNKKYYLSK